MISKVPSAKGGLTQQDEWILISLPGGRDPRARGRFQASSQVGTHGVRRLSSAGRPGSGYPRLHHTQRHVLLLQLWADKASSSKATHAARSGGSGRLNPGDGLEVHHGPHLLQKGEGWVFVLKGEKGKFCP